MRYDRETVIEQARKVRRNGHTLSQIANMFSISKSTASLWTSNQEITIEGKEKIIKRQNKARQKALMTISKRRSLVKNEIEKKALLTLRKIDVNHHLGKLLCAIFIWTEGEKGNFNRLGFANSDPKMVETFLNLLRKSFQIDETKMRALVHIHEYHDKDKVLNFWSKVTKIPLSQFNKSYLKPHTGKRKREGYMGSIHISYFDYMVARELASVYNIFADKLRGVG